MLQKAICANGGSGPMAGGKFYGNCLLESPSLHLAPSGAMLCKKDISRSMAQERKRVVIGKIFIFVRINSFMTEAFIL